MQALTVLYDPECGLCRRSHEWLSEQSKIIELKFVPCASDEARKHFPQLNHDLTKKDLTVVDDEGGVYFGPKAWLMVLPAGRAGTLAHDETCSVDDFAESIPDQPSRRTQ